MTDIDGWARDLLRCPICGATLSDGTTAGGSPTLVCDGAEPHAFPVRDGIPVLLADEVLPGPVGE